MSTLESQLRNMWNLQRSVLERVDSIEQANGQRLAGVYPVDYNSREGQARLRYWVNNYCEELSEAYNEMLEGNRDNLLEELVDCFKFLINLCLQCDLDYPSLALDRLPPEQRNLARLMVYGIIPEVRSNVLPSQVQWMYCYGDIHMACTLLRNQPWRQKEKPLEIQAFHSWLARSLGYFFGLVRVCGFSSEDFIEMFRAKTRVNIDRVREGR